MNNTNDCTFRWQFLENNTKWKDVDSRLSTKLDALAVNNSLKYSFGRWTYTVQKITTNKCVQTNNSTKNERDLRRILCDKNNKTENTATIYLQYGFYTKYQMETITAKFNDKLEKYIITMLCFGYCRLNGLPFVISDLCQKYFKYFKAIKYTSDDLCYDGFPKLLFGDHFQEKYRLSDMKRKRFGGQSRILGEYDKTFGFGISTGFKLDVYVIGFDKWTELILKEFEILKYNLLNNGDIIIPIPSHNELRNNGHLYYHNQTGKQVINHTIGTGNASLPFHFRLYIQKQIDKLKFYANSICVVEQQLYQ